MTRVRVGVTLPQFTDDPEVLIDGARRAEAAGLDSIWLFDHLWPLTGGRARAMFEAWTSLAYLAAATDRVEIGTLVTRSTLRHPAVLAKMAATVAAVAPGRLIVGIGSGDRRSRPENRSFGLPYYGGTERVAQLVSTVRAVRSYVTEPAVSLADGFVSLEDLPASPRPEPPPRVWIGGRTAGVLATAGKHADGWNAWGCSPAEFRRDASLVLAGAGDRRVGLSWGGQVVLAASDSEARAKLGDRDPAAFLIGSPGNVAGHLSELAAAGADHLIVTFPDSRRPENYEALAAMAIGEAP